MNPQKRADTGHQVNSCLGGSIAAIEETRKPWMSSRQRARAGKAKVNRWHKDRGAWRREAAAPSKCVDITHLYK